MDLSVFMDTCLPPFPSATTNVSVFSRAIFQTVFDILCNSHEESTQARSLKSGVGITPEFSPIKIEILGHSANLWVGGGQEFKTGKNWDNTIQFDVI